MAFRTNKMPVLQTKSASGAIATFNTALAMPLSSCNIDVNAWQEGSGDPYPAGGSAQIWDEVTENGVLNTTTGANQDNNNALRTKNYVSVLSNTSYYCSASQGSGYDIWCMFYDNNYDVITGYSTGRLTYNNASEIRNSSFVTPSNCSYIRFYITPQYGTPYKNDISINYPATDTAYHPYSNIRPIHGFSEVNITHNTDVKTKQLGETVYGGSYNSVSGKKSKTWDKFKIRDFTWVYNAASAYFAANTTGKAFGSTNLICEVLTIDTRSSGSMANYTIKGADSAERIIIKDTNATSSTELINDIGDYYIAFELAEPIESNIGATPISTNIGNNTIFADTGDIDLTYKDLDIAKRGNFREVFKLPS